MKRIRILTFVLMILLLVGCNNLSQKSPITSIDIAKNSTVVEELEVLVGDTFKLESQINDNL